MLAEITSFLAERDLYGLIWCDEALAATHVFGKLAAFVPLDQHICQSLLPLMGFDEQIRALRRQPDRCVEVPNISIRHGETTGPRLNINVYWIARRKLYLVVLSRVLRRSDLEFELNNQIRAKRIAERLVAEKSRELQRVNRELTRANDDLEEFAYVISHDLKAPLRALRYLIEDLEQSLDGAPVLAARAQLEQVQRQTRRMSAMLSGLFDYASLGRKQDAMTLVDSHQLATEIISSLRAPAGLTVSLLGDWPQLQTLEQPLDLVLRNLIGNAIKHHDREIGSIRVRAQDGPEFISIEVADDGPGIPADYRDAVFRAFLKVEEDNNPDSSGVGLALVKKSVEGIGGSIELVSDRSAGRGASFLVMWPKLPEL